MNVRLRGAVGCLVVALALVCAAKLLAAAPQQGVGVQQKKPNADIENAFRSPEFELKGKLAKIFRLSHCEYISGLTCRIHYNGALALPSELFFTEFDDHGKQAGPPVRLIYPKLNPGETGVATFRIRLSTPAKIVLEAEWKGPWRDPY
ncbi:MAG: hypothetical protein WA405_06310 [Candidatus Acidiferrales bacterium]